MSDRSYVELTIRKTDLKLMEELNGGLDNVEEETERFISGDIIEAVGGGWEDWQTLAKKGAVFFGVYEGYIGVWEAQAFCAIDGKYHEIPCRPSEGVPRWCLRIGPDCKPIRGALKEAKAYFAALKKIKDALGIKHDHERARSHDG